MTTPPPILAAKPRSKWRRRFLVLGAFMLVIAGCVAALPSIVSLQTFKPRVERALSAELGVPVTVRSYGLGWLSGMAVDGLEIAQPPGFAAERPLLTLERMRLQIGWLRAMRGEFDVAGEVQGVRVLVIQKADGTSNLQALAASGGDSGSPRSRRSQGDAGPDAAELLKRLRADFALRDVAIDVVHEEKGQLESIRRLDATVDKRFGSTDFDLQMNAELAAADGDRPPGKLQIDAAVDGSLQRPIDVQFTSAGFDFARYRPLVDAVLGPDQLSALDGILDGTIKARIENLDTVLLQGALTVDRPHFGGALLQGMNVQATRWVLNPNLRLALGTESSVPHADLDGFSLDLGLLQVRGVPADSASASFAGAPALALDFDVDLQAVGKLGGPVPAQLGEQAGRLSGRAALQIPAGGFAINDVLQFVKDSLHVDANVKVPQLALGAASSLLGVDLGAKLDKGTLKLALAPGASLNGGALELSATVDITQDNWPTSVEVGVKNTDLVVDSVRALQYAVPLFAGLAQQAGVDVAGRGSLTLAFAGPGNKVAAESWLTWLNRWSGNGALALAECSLRPAASFAALVQFADPESQGRLAFKDVGTDFVLRQGGVETALTRLDVKGKKIGIRGKTMLDGSMDHKLDLTELLAGHKDGDKVLKYLKGTPIEGAITGTLLSPALSMPDMQALIGAALQNAAKEQVQKNADDLLRKGLDELFKRKK